MFYKNVKRHKRVKEKNLTFSIFQEGVTSGVDDSVAGPVECKSFYNLTYQDGALKTGFGFKELELPASEDDLADCHPLDYETAGITRIKGIWNFRWYNMDFQTYAYQLLICDQENRIHMIPFVDEYEGFLWLKSVYMPAEPKYACPYRIKNSDCMLFFTEKGMMYMNSMLQSIFDDMPELISSVVHYDKFFGITNTDRNVLIYTSNLDITTWADEQNSTIEFLDNRGAFTKLVAFNDYVYLFREYGITKISIYTSKGDFSFTHLYTSPSKIFEGSICACGDKVFFATRDGLYSFNGSTAQKIVGKLDKYFQVMDNANCCSACLNRKYYLATRINFQDGEIVGCENGEFKNNCVLEIDISNFDINLYRGSDIKKFLVVDNPHMSKLCVVLNDLHCGKIGELCFDGQTFGEANKKSWSSYKTDLGFQSKRKNIKEICLETAYDCSVKILSDENEKIYFFDGNSKENRKKINISGKSFQFVFETSCQYCDIKKPMIVFDMLE